MTDEKSLNPDSQGLWGIVANDPDGKIIVDKKDIVLFANPAAMRLFERETGKFVGHKFKYTVIPGKDAEIEFLKKDGSVGRAEMRSSVATWQKQEVLLVSLRDITGRGWVEELLDRNATLSVVFESAPNIMMLVDEDGRVLDINRAGVEFAGRNKEELLGLLGGDIFNCLNSFHGKGCGKNAECADCPVRSRVMRTLETQEPIFNEEGEFEIERHGETVKLHILISTSPINISGGKQVLVTITDITERKTLEQTLRLEDQRYREFFMNSPFGYQSLDFEGRIKDVNQAWINGLGYSREEVIGKWFGDFLAPEQADIFRERFPKFKAAGKTHVEFLMKHKDGSMTLEAIDGKIAYDMEGKFKHTHCVLQDVTEKRRTEDAIRSSENMLRQAEAFARLGSWKWDIKLNKVIWSDEMYRIFGLEKDRFSGDLNEVISQSIHPDDRAAVEASNRTVIKEGKPEPLSYRIVKPEGTIRWVWAEAGELQMDEQGIPIFLSGYVQDITERKKAEEQLKASEEKYRFLLDNVPSAISIVQDGKIIFANPRVEELTGYPFSELTENNGFDLIHPDDREMVKRRYEKRKRGEDAAKAYSLRIIRKNGDVACVRRRVSTIEWEGKSAELVMDVDITERMTAEEELKKSEEKYRIVADFTHDWEYWMGNDGQFRYMSPSCERLTGYKREEFLNDSKLYSRIVHPQDRQKIVEHYKQAADSDDMEELEFRLIRRDGAERWFSHVCHPVIGDDGRYLGRRASNRDVTSRKKAEEEIKERDQRFEQLLADTLEIIQSVGMDGKFRFVNHAWNTLLEYSEEEVGQLTIADIIHPSCMEQCMSMFKDVLEGKSLRNIEAKFVSKSGRTIEVEGNAEPRYSGDEVIATHGFFRDVTARKQMEQSLEKAAEEWRTTFDSITDMVATVDTNHKVVRVNQAFAVALDLTPADIIGRHCYEVIHGMNQPHPSCPHTRTLETKRVESSEYLDKKLKIWVEASSSPIFNDEGQLTGSVHIIKNISNRKKAEEEEQQLRQKAEMSSRLAAVGEMASGIAHEINNPLTGVIGFSELLLGRTDLPENIREELKIINDGSQRVKEIVRRMLTFARQAKPVKSSVSITELIDNTLELRSYVMKTGNIEVIRDYDPDLPWVTADAGQLQQVFLNLIVNAEYAMKKAHDKGILIIKTEKRDGHIRIYITDDGMGMPEGVKNKLFQPFFTTKEPGEGTGLGLALSMGIIHEHGGSVTVESVEGQGTTFIITLPVTVEEEKVELEIPVIETGQDATHRAQILVVDDEPTVGALVRVILTGIGHEVTDCRTSQEALEKLKESTYDLVILDIRMPGMGGIELQDEIKAKWPEMANRVIFLTGDTSDLVTREYLKAHEVPYITKPFERRELEEKVNDILNGRPEG